MRSNDLDSLSCTCTPLCTLYQAASRWHALDRQIAQPICQPVRARFGFFFSQISILMIRNRYFSSKSKVDEATFGDLPTSCDFLACNGFGFEFERNGYSRSSIVRLLEQISLPTSSHRLLFNSRLAFIVLLSKPFLSSQLTYFVPSFLNLKLSELPI